MALGWKPKKPDESKPSKTASGIEFVWEDVRAEIIWRTIVPVGTRRKIPTVYHKWCWSVFRGGASVGDGREDDLEAAKGKAEAAILQGKSSHYRLRLRREYPET